MARRKAPVVEGLEGRSLLSSLSYSLTTSAPVYSVGQPIELTFTETNVSTQPVTVEVSPADFTVSQNNAAIWQSNSSIGGQAPISETLLPGKSISQTASWNGTSTLTLPGATTGLTSDPTINDFGSFTVTNPNAPAGMTAAFQITDPITESLTTNQSVYSVGTPVQMTFTEVNTADQAITIPFQAPAGFTVWQGGKLVLGDVLPQFVTTTTTLKANQTITATETWDGTSLGASGGSTLTGAFVVGYGPQANPTQLSTTIQIVPSTGPSELVSSITTNQSSYTSGQPVNITFTETNDGTQPISIETGAPDFQITQNGAVVWTSAGTGATASGSQPGSATLAPGQSYTQTTTWTGTLAPTSAVAQATGTFVVTNLLDPNKESATFTIVPVTSPTPPGQNPGPPVSNPISSPTPPGQSPGTVPVRGLLPPIIATVSTDQTSYQAGQSVHIALTLQNVTTSPVPTSSKKNVETITVFSGSTPVYESSHVVRALSSGAIKPGKVVKLASSWSGRANRGGVKNISPGVYTIQVSDGGYVASTTVQVVGRHGKSKVR